MVRPNLLLDNLAGKFFRAHGIRNVCWEDWTSKSTYVAQVELDGGHAFLIRHLERDGHVFEVQRRQLEFQRLVKICKLIKVCSGKINTKYIMPIDTVSNLVFWSRLVNKLEHWHIVYILQQMTKPSNLHLIDRLQFPWLTASNGLW